MLKNKKIILGISGGIAAYKAPLLIRELIKKGAEVRAILTSSAEKFVSKLVIQNLTKYNVPVQMFEEGIQSGGAWHIELAEWADVMLIAPCTANTLAKLAFGICDSPLLTVALALNERAKLLVAPSMDCGMYNHATVQRNMEIVKLDGVRVIPPDVGELSSGLYGSGRLPDVSVLVKELENSFIVNKLSTEEINTKNVDSVQDTIKWQAELEFEKLKQNKNKKLFGKKVLITAGPTFEKIDDVRYIGNYSSGKMGFALAKIAEEMGAEVILISGPVALDTPSDNIKRINVESAEEMLEATKKYFAGTYITIMSAAVADFTPKNKFEGKIKKREIGENMSIELSPTVDILKELGKKKGSSQILVGFALESEKLIEYASNKLEEKNCDFIVANHANKPDSGFQSDNNTISIIDKKKNVYNFPPSSKEECAKIILNKITE